MGKKLLSQTIPALLFLLLSAVGYGQCPTSVSISADPGNNICSGTSVTFTANTNGGSGTFSYQWKIDGNNFGTNSNTFTSSTLENADKVSVVVSSSESTTCSISSSDYTMTVNATKTPTVSVSANKTSICPGESVSFTASNTNGGTSPQYSFFLNNQTTALQSGSSNVFSTTSLNDGDQIKVLLTSSLNCATSDTAENSSSAVTVRAGTPAVPGNIATSVGTEICPGTSQTYSISAVAGATSYQWILPSGWSGSSTTTSINVTAGTSNGSISVKAINDCGTSDAKSLGITIKAGTPAVPGTITGTASVCPGVSETYSVTAVSGATEYIWTFPGGWSGTSTTNSITVTTGASGSGNISVQAKNDCGTSTAKTLAVAVKPGTPATPGTISGTAAVCPGISQTYSVSNVTGATSYIWTLPNGWTGTSTTNSITVTTGTAGGNVNVKAINDCGTSSEQILAVTVKAGTPAQPTNFTAGPAEVCPGTTATYTVPIVTGATSYIWTIPSGFTAPNLITTTPSITITAGSSGSGNITVKASNDCGTGAVRSMAITIGKPAPVMSGSITGSARVCSTATGLVYSIPAITNATEYTWTLPSGWNITAGGTTNSITVSAASTTSNGSTISVVAKNSCGTSSAANFTVKAFNSVPAKPGDISTTLTTAVICPPVNNIKFSVPLDQTGSTTSYNWILPTGFQIVSGAGTNEITVNITTTAAYGNNIKVEVEAVNSCGPSTRSTYSNINLDKFVVTNLGEDKTVCAATSTLNLNGYVAFGTGSSKLKVVSITSTGTNQVQGLPNGNVNDFPFQYTPSNQDLTVGKVTFTVTTETPAGSCAAGTDQMTVFFKPLPTATITATSPICSGNTSSLTFTGTPNSRVSYRLGSNTAQTVDIPASGTINVTTPVLTANSTYSLVSSVNLDTPACTSNLTGSATITVTPKPTATITYAGTPFCNSVSTGQNPTLTGTNAFTGGTYSSTAGLTINGSTGAITPSSSTPGTYTVTYSTPAGGGCTPVTTTTQVTITKAPTASISYAGTPFCTSDSTAKAVTLTGTDGFTGGTFSAPTGLTINSSTGAITASSSTPGTYTVSYNTPAAGGCSPVSVTTEVIITKAPTATISYPQAPFCLSDNSLKPVTITGTDIYTGGTYSAPAGLSINSSSGEINPSASSVGSYTVTYTSPATGGCAAVTATTEVTITQTPAAEISYTGPFCNNDEALKAVTFSNTAGAYQGGTFSVNPSTGLSINVSTGEIVANTSSPGEYTVIYTIPAGNGCSTSEISTKVSITESPSVDIRYTTPLCTSDAATYPVTFSNQFGAYQGGTFTGTTGLSIDANGNISPANSTPGVHTITYTTIAAEGCGSFQTTTEVEIFKEVVITTEPVNVGICSTEPASFEVVASGDNLTYQWKRKDGAPITNATGVNSSKLSFSNATATNAGEYFVEVSGSSPCTMAVSATVTLNIDENIVIIKPTEDLSFCDDTREEVTFEFIAHAKGAPLSFTWVKDGADIPNTNTERFIFDVTGPVGEDGQYTGTFQILGPNPSDNGVYSVRIKGPDYFTCSDAETKTFTLNVNPLPNPPGTENVVYCQNAAASPLTATGENGATFTWYDANNNKLDGVPTPSTSEPGTIKYFVTQTTAVCESNPSELIVTVKPTPAAPTTSSAVVFCFGDTVTDPLTATKNDSGSTLNWYGPDNQNAVLNEAPIPLTTTTGTTKYWVSETFDGCESPLVEIVVTVNALPTITVAADQAVICEGSTTTLRATGGISYEWFIGENSVGTGADFPVSPIVETTYKVVGTNENGCKNSATITIKVDEPTLPGTLTGPESVCITSPSGILNLADHRGDILRWEQSTNGGTSWTSIVNTSATMSFENISAATTYRAIIKNGVCGELSSNEVTISIDPLPIGGDLNFAGNGRVFTICENPVGNYAVDLNLTGKQGNVAGWYYRAWNATGYTPLNIGGELFTGTTLTAAQIQALNLNQTTVFQVEINSGACTPNALSKTAIISVIPSDITPSPVTVAPGVICLGEEVTLNSETGYETGGTILDQGAFDNASITNHGWRIRREGISGDLGFDTDANNTEFDRWKRATPRNFTTASINSPYNTSGVLFDTGIEDGNKGFALISGNYRSTMETPVFTIGSMDQAVLTFDQAYVLTPGASLRVEISTDGGNTYTTLYVKEVPGDASKGIESGNTTNFGTGTIDTKPENKILIDLGDYIGRPNLRIRFNYSGKRPGDIWAVDNIDIPEGPNGITMEWRDYTDATKPEGVLIGTNNTEKWPPTKVGLNVFEVKTKLVYNSNGDACEVAENAQRVEVFVFDKYTSTTTAVMGSCGNNSAKLSATVTNSSGTVMSAFPTPDGYIGTWVIEPSSGYTLIDSNTEDGIAAENDPNAILSVESDVSAFKASFVLTPTLKNAEGVLYANTNCLPVATALDIQFQSCTTLDFDGVDDFVDLGTGYTGDYSIEAWIMPEAATGTVISTPQLEINMTDLTGVTPNTRWYHIAVDSDGLLYIDGISTGNKIEKTGTARAFIGARWNAPDAENHFSGWIEEVRIWNTKISEKNIRFTMNQRLKGDGNIGVIVDMEHPDAPSFANLAGYYQLIATDILPGGYTADLAGTAVNGKLRNMTTVQENTAPLPYYTAQVGSWDTPATWGEPDLWKLANTGGIDWNIVRTSHNVTAERDVTVLGLVSEQETLTMVGQNPTSWTGGGTGKELFVSHYLLLNGIIDLNGESQLVQPELSIVAESSVGALHRDQQGTQNSFNYNYWSSPVSVQGAANNSGYSVGAVLHNPNGSIITYVNDPYAADATALNPVNFTLSSYWLWKFAPGAVDMYSEWDFIGDTGALKTGEGFTMKGTSGAATITNTQNYTFIGKPHNGDIILQNFGVEQNYLIGNPYPSAIDAEEFIKDNLKDIPNNQGRNTQNVFDGSLYFWDHFDGGDTHILAEYVGGYATLNLSGSVPAITNDYRVDYTAENGTKLPGRYIPVGQSFLINSSNFEKDINISGGPVHFKNSQRVFFTEGSAESIFLKPEVVVKGNKQSDKEPEKIRISYSSPMGLNRQILVGAVPSATNGFDLGYDAPLYEDNVEDMYWLIKDQKLVIQGVGNFDKDQKLPLGVKLKDKGEFTIKIDKLENFAEDKMVYLHDKVMDTIHDLRDSPYKASAEGGTYNERFEVIFFKEQQKADPPVEEIPTEEVPGNPELEVTDLTIRHSHTRKEIQILNPDELPLSNLYIFDLNGNQLHNYKNLSHEKEVRLPVRNFSKGVYIIKLYTNSRVISKKIIIDN